MYTGHNNQCGTIFKNKCHALQKKEPILSQGELNIQTTKLKLFPSIFKKIITSQKETRYQTWGPWETTETKNLRFKI